MLGGSPWRPHGACGCSGCFELQAAPFPLSPLVSVSGKTPELRGKGVRSPGPLRQYAPGQWHRCCCDRQAPESHMTGRQPLQPFRETVVKWTLYHTCHFKPKGNTQLSSVKDNVVCSSPPSAPQTFHHPNNNPPLNTHSSPSPASPGPPSTSCLCVLTPPGLVQMEPSERKSNGLDTTP